MPKQIPILARLWPFHPLNALFLIQSGIAMRELVGATRIVADAPIINPNNISKRDKWRTMLERFFMDALGTTGGFVVLQAAQDGFDALYSGMHAGHPETLLHRLPKEHQGPILEALKQTFGFKDVEKPGRLLYQTLYKGANLHQFTEVLKKNGHADLVKLINPGSLKLPANETGKLVQQFFKHHGNWGVGAVLTGVAANTLIAGILWQYLNDNWFRKKVVPKLLDKMGIPETPMLPGQLPYKPFLLASQPLQAPLAGANTIMPTRSSLPKLGTPAYRPSAALPATLPLGGMR